MEKHIFRIRLLLFFGLSGLGTLELFGQGLDTKNLEEELNQIRQQYDYPGFGVSVVGPDTIYFMKGFGDASIKRKKPYTSQTIQNIASISKTLIGVSLMKAEKLGLLKLDDPVSDHLPFPVQNPFYPHKIITIRNLATHTSSIKDRFWVYEIKGYHWGGDPHISLEEFMDHYFRQKGKWYKKKNYYQHEPGTVYEYSNIGAALAAYIIEHKSGQEYSEFTRQHILEPLEMKYSGWYYSEVDGSLLAELYSSNKKKKRLYSLLTYPDGGLRTNIEDLTIFFRMVLNRGTLNGVEILDPESVFRMLKPQFQEGEMPENFSMINQGIFWEHDNPLIDRLQVGHSGGDPGVTTLMFFLPESNIGVIVLANFQFNRKNLQGAKDAWSSLIEYCDQLADK